MHNYSVMARALFALVLLGTVPPSMADVVVVVSAKSTATPLSADQAAEIFLGRAITLPGAGDVVPIDQSEGSPARDVFYQKVAGKNAAQLRAYWSKQIFTGKGTPPKDVSNDGAVKAMVAAKPGLIGYIDKDAVDASVKALLTIK